MDPLHQALAAVSTKTLGIMLGTTPVPIIGIRPAHHLIQVAGTPNPLSPLDRGIMNFGFRHLALDDDLDIKPHASWTIQPTPDGGYETTYNGETMFHSTRPAPEKWHDMIRHAGWCLLVWQHTAGQEIDSAELLLDMDAGNTLAVTAGYTP